jgi:hypothetical protein
MTIDDERTRIQRQLDYLGESMSRVDQEVDKLRDGLPAAVKAAIKEAMPEVVLSADEQRSLRLLIKRQEQNLKLREAIIEKSLTALMWAAIVGVGLMIKEYMVSHGMWKP